MYAQLLNLIGPLVVSSDAPNNTHTHIDYGKTFCKNTFELTGPQKRMFAPTNQNQLFSRTKHFLLPHEVTKNKSVSWAF